MANYFKGQRKNRNTKKRRIEKKAVLLALEDTKSSKYYFEKLIQDKGLTGKVIFAKHCGTDPENVVQAIVTHLNQNKENIYEKKWAIIDKDDYSKAQINGAIQRARTLGIFVAISNEAYELWLLLHFRSVTAYTNREVLKKELNHIFNDKFKIQYDKASHDVYQLIIGQQATAIKNSKMLVNTYIRENGKLDPFYNNPITMIYQLVEYLNALYSNNPQNTDLYFP